MSPSSPPGCILFCCFSVAFILLYSLLFCICSYFIKYFHFILFLFICLPFYQKHMSSMSHVEMRMETVCFTLGFFLNVFFISHCWEWRDLGVICLLCLRNIRIRGIWLGKDVYSWFCEETMSVRDCCDPSYSWFACPPSSSVLRKYTSPPPPHTPCTF